MSVQLPVVLITPEARAALEAEVERAGIGGGLVGGLLFGYPLGEGHRLVVSSVRLRAEVGFGQRTFSLGRSRTSQQLAQARRLAPAASYCGVWYLHRTPSRELTGEEWTEAQHVLEDPDFRFQDLVCLVLCSYSGALNIYASSYDRSHVARAQPPAPTALQLATDSPAMLKQAGTGRPSNSLPWYEAADVVRRLKLEHERLAAKYQVKAAVAPNGQLVFRLTPQGRYEKLVFYLACGGGFPNKGPVAFLAAGGKQHALSGPLLSDWSDRRWLVEVADDLVDGLKWSLGQYMVAAEEALDRGDYQEAADLLTAVLSVDPRTPGAGRLLARAQARLS
jgi:hypothetical protein